MAWTQRRCCVGEREERENEEREEEGRRGQVG